jgi:hypothetical protein
MRKKINYQKTDYAQNGELLCFGLSEHTLTENMPRFSEKAQKDIEVLKALYDKNEDLLCRPAYKSDFTLGTDINRAKMRLLLGGLIIRELPIRSFTARCVIIYLYATYFIGRGIGKGFRDYKPVVHYLTPYAKRVLTNHPDFFDFALGRVLPKIPITTTPNREWRMKQQPVYHQYHRCTYRYRLRQPRYIPWDGTMSQPVMPFLIDDSTGVINGTFRRNPNTTPECK